MPQTARRSIRHTAPGVRDEPSLAHIVTRQLCEAVHSLGLEVLGAVLAAIPLAVDVDVLEPEVGAEVDDFEAVGEGEVADNLLRRRVREAAEDDVARGVPVGDGVVRDEGREARLGEAELREDVAHGVPRVALRGRESRYRGARVRRQEAYELDACVARGAEDADADGGGRHARGGP